MTKKTVDVPMTPPPELLVSMAMRADHAFGMDKLSDSPFDCGYTPERRQALLARVEAAYRAAVAAGRPGGTDGVVRFPTQAPHEVLLAMARAYRPGFDDLPTVPPPGWASCEHEQVLLDMARFVEEMTGAGYYSAQRAAYYAQFTPSA